MTDTRYWTKDFMLIFIEEYKCHACLWKIRSKEYINKNLKNEAYEKLVKLCKSIYPEANRDFVVKKIQNLRGSFRKEAKKVEESKRSGASQVVFTKDQEIPTSSISNISDIQESDNFEEQYVEHVDVSLSEESTPIKGKESNENTEISI
ncbi:hypothetical protein MML48_9g00013382 [Holotrichia oblita]|uniref:Uncharacterized protein n=1 Tax=Holotrichia oblita TaxID=644536 RepID=A0ACB9SGL6_HOLOL|nr:hypothetical protein MML48_9g00013382 [Holotrichia oblita]